MSDTNIDLEKLKQDINSLVPGYRVIWNLHDCALTGISKTESGTWCAEFDTGLVFSTELSARDKSPKPHFIEGGPDVPLTEKGRSWLNDLMANFSKIPGAEIHFKIPHDAKSRPYRLDVLHGGSFSDADVYPAKMSITFPYPQLIHEAALAKRNKEYTEVASITLKVLDAALSLHGNPSVYDDSRRIVLETTDHPPRIEITTDYDDLAKAEQRLSALKGRLNAMIPDNCALSLDDDHQVVVSLQNLYVVDLNRYIQETGITNIERSLGIAGGGIKVLSFLNDVALDEGQEPQLTISLIAPNTMPDKQRLLRELYEKLKPFFDDQGGYIGLINGQELTMANYTWNFSDRGKISNLIKESVSSQKGKAGQ